MNPYKPSTSANAAPKPIGRTVLSPWRTLTHPSLDGKVHRIIAVSIVFMLPPFAYYLHHTSHGAREIWLALWLCAAIPFACFLACIGRLYILPAVGIAITTICFGLCYFESQFILGLLVLYFGLVGLPAVLVFWGGGIFTRYRANKDG